MAKFTAYKEMLNQIVDEGEWIVNERTNTKCLTIPDVTMRIDVKNGIFPIDTLRKSFWQSAVKEFIGYLRGYDNAYDFLEALGVKTWLANANDNPTWLKNPNRKCAGDMGQAYRFRPIGFIPYDKRTELIEEGITNGQIKIICLGNTVYSGDVFVFDFDRTKVYRYIANSYTYCGDNNLEFKTEAMDETNYSAGPDSRVELNLNGEGVDQVQQLVDNIMAHKDDRGLIMTAWKPDTFDKACLRPCMHTHEFTIINGKLYHHGYQRSTDATIGANFNMVQCYFFLAVMAHLSGLEPQYSTWHPNKVHIYDNQWDVFVESGHKDREVKEAPKFIISDELTDFQQLMVDPDPMRFFSLEWPNPDDKMGEAIQYPFTV